jgi:hypothetical protein
MPDTVTLNQPAQNTIPQAPAQTSAPDMESAPDPRAGLGGASPDMSPLDGLSTPSNGAPQLANQHRTLNTVLKAVAYSLAGAAAGGGEKRPGEAAAAGVKTGIGLAQQEKENRRADAEGANRTAETQSRIKFQNIQAAEASARAAMYDQQLHNMPQEFQDAHNAKTAAFMKDMQDLGITPTIMADNHSHGANTALEQLTNSHGGVPHMFVLNLGDKLVGYDLGQMTDNAGIRDQVNKIAEIQGKGANAYTPSRWGLIGKEGREQITQQALGFFMPMPTKDNVDSLLQQYKNYQQTYAQNPNADKTMKAKLDDTVKMLEGSRETLIQQKGEEAASVANAEIPAKVEAARQEMPIKIATAKGEEKARIDTQLSAANTEGQGARLVEGDMDPSQMSKRSNIYNATLDAADHYSMAKYGKHFDLAQAQSDYKFATNPSTQNKLKYLNSLTGNPVTGDKGILDKLIEQSKKVKRTDFPALNDGANWLRLQTGDPEIVKLHDLVVDASEQFATIMNGGGTGNATSDAKIKLGQELFKSGFSQKMLEGSASTINDMLSTRKREFIGTNRYLLRQYGGGAAAPAGPAGGATPQTHAFSVKAWKAANPNGDESAARAAAQAAGFTVTD